jgi:hypothetical protein
MFSIPFYLIFFWLIYLLLYLSIYLSVLIITIYIKYFIKKNHLSNTYSKIETQVNKIAKSQRYAIVFEFYYKKIFPPPFALISYILVMISFIESIYRSCLTNDTLKKSSKNKKINNIRNFLRCMTKIESPGFG